jgi:hypothetical protein
VQFEGAMAGDLKIYIEKLEARTKAGRLRGLMPIIEAKVKQGIRHVDIIQALNEQASRSASTRTAAIYSAIARSRLREANPLGRARRC